MQKMTIHLNDGINTLWPNFCGEMFWNHSGNFLPLQQSIHNTNPTKFPFHDLSHSEVLLKSILKNCFEKLFSAAKSFGLHIFRLQVFSSFGRIREDWLPFIITFSEFKSAAWVSIADQASDRTSDVSLRNSNNSRQCGLDLRLGRSSRLSTCCCCLWPASPSSPQTPPSAFSPRGREKQAKNLLLDHLAWNILQVSTKSCPCFRSTRIWSFCA